MPRARHPGRRDAVLLSAALLLLTAGPGCGGDDEDARPESTTSTEPTTTTTTLTPEEEVEAVYLEFVDVVYRLLTTEPDPDDAELDRLAIDPVLSRTRDSLTTMRAENHIVERGSRTSQEILSSAITDHSTARLRVCSVGNDTTIDRDDGSVVDAGLTSYLLEVEATLHSGMWRISNMSTIERFDGEATCG